MSRTLDELAPMTVGATALTLSLADAVTTPLAFRAVDISVDYTGAGSDGVALPLEMIVTGPSAQSFYRHVFRRSVPSTITFTPREGGEFHVLLREVGHNRLRGKLRVAVAGDRVIPPHLE